MSSGFDSSLIGAITINNNIDKINKQINEVKNSATIIQGSANSGNFIPPTIIINPPSDSLILQQETFGPVMSIQSFNSLDNVIKLANNTGYGLSASIFGKNKNNISFVTRRLNVGAIAINDVLTFYGVSDLPFGGLGLSGIVKVHGKEGLRSFSRQKSYIKPLISLKSEFWWYENNKLFSKYLKKWLKL